MTVNWTFGIKPGTKPSEPSLPQPYIADECLYRKVYELMEPEWKKQFSRFHPPGHPDSYVWIDLPEESPLLHQVVGLLRQAGWEPLLAEEFDQGLRATHYWVRRLRHYDKNDYKNAEYFRIERWGDASCVLQCAGMRDGHLVGRVAGAKWKKRYGNAWKKPSYPHLVNGELKDELEQANLRGLSFQPVLFDQPEKAKGSFWCIYSSITMPKSRLPMYHTMVSGDNGRVEFCLYDDAGHYPVELVYDRREIEAMEPFEAALASLEELGHPDLQPWQRELIVSAKCRKVMLTQLRMTSVQFIPVRLVGE